MTAKERNRKKAARSELQEWRGKYINYVRLTQSEKTALRYDKALEVFFSRCKGKYRPADIYRADVEDFKIIRKREGVNNATINLELTAGRNLFDFIQQMREQEVIINPFRNVKSLKEAETRKRALPLADVEKIMAAATDRYEKLLALLAFTTGLRGEEMALVEKKHFDLAAQVLHLPAEIVKGKAKGRDVPVRDDLAAMLRDWPDGKLFAGWANSQKSLYYHWRRLCWKANVPVLGLHATRHTYGTNMLRAGADLATVRDLLGHKDIKTTGTYLAGEEAAEMKKFLTRLPGLPDNQPRQ